MVPLLDVNDVLFSFVIAFSLSPQPSKVVDYIMCTSEKRVLYLDQNISGLHVVHRQVVPYRTRSTG